MEVTASLSADSKSQSSPKKATAFKKQSAESEKSNKFKTPVFQNKEGMKERAHGVKVKIC